MIVPGRLAMLAATVLAMMLVAAVVDWRIVSVVLTTDVVLILLVLSAGRRLRQLPVDVRRDDHGRGQVGREQQLTFRIANRADRPVIVRFRQPWPLQVSAPADTAEFRVEPGEVVRASLTVVPTSRGSVDLPAATYEVRLVTADLARVRGNTEPGRLRVFPSMRGLAAFEALRQHHASALAGSHRHRMIGSGREFEQVRDYGPDDDFREMNWKATARRSRPITNVYQAERSQDVMLCLDCGRTMGNPVGGGHALDHAVDAAVLLAHVASRQGDRVGLVLFRDIVMRVLKPAGGMTAIHRMLDELVDARAEPVFPSFSALAAALRSNQTRRAFVFLFTDLNDPQLAANLAEVLPLISRRHAVVVVSLRDPLLDRIASGPAHDRRGVFAVLAAHHIYQERATRVKELQRLGATVIEADAGSISTRSINAYLSAKARQLV